MRRPGPLRDEVGAASAETAVVMPALVLVLLLVVQFALYYHASNVVAAAAQHAATTAQAERGSSSAGHRAAQSFLAQTADGLLSAPRVDVSRGRDTTHVRVRARVVSLVPGLGFTVQAEADGPVERFYRPDER